MFNFSSYSTFDIVTSLSQEKLPKKVVKIVKQENRYRKTKSEGVVLKRFLKTCFLLTVQNQGETNLDVGLVTRCYSPLYPVCC